MIGHIAIAQPSKDLFHDPSLFRYSPYSKKEDSTVSQKPFFSVEHEKNNGSEVTETEGKASHLTVGQTKDVREILNEFE